MHALRAVLSAVVLALPLAAQDVTATPGGVSTPPRSEPVLPALSRTNPDTLALTLAPGKTLLLHDFDFNGEPVSSDKIHLHQLAPGVYELLSVAYASGFWRFKITDSAAIYGLGEHFDTLDHALSILHNLPIALAPGEPHGATTPRPVPFFLSATGYALALDPNTEATFDLNATDATQLIVDLTAARFRVLLFTGDPGKPGRFPDLLAQDQATAGPTLPAPVMPFDRSFLTGNGLPAVVTAALNAGLSGLAPSIPSLTSEETPDPLFQARWTELSAFLPGTSINETSSAVAQRYAALHNALAPYFKAAATASSPAVRPLVFDFQDDGKARALQTEYLLGPSLLVAPVLDENTSRPVYLPAGDWLNFFTGDPVTGPRTLIAQAPADTIPVFARRGSILLRDEAGIPAAHPVGELLGLAGSVTTTLVSSQNRTFTRTANTLTITGEAPGSITLRWRFGAPHNATLNGQPLNLKIESDGTATATFDYTAPPAAITWQ